MSDSPSTTASVRNGSEAVLVALVATLVLWDAAYLLGLQVATLGPLPARVLQGAIALLAALLLVGRAALAGPRYAVVALAGVPVAALYAFTGQILPWDQLSFWLAQSVLEVLLAVPVVGPIGADLLFGGFTLSSTTLELAWTYHYGITALLTVGVLGYLGLRGPGLLRTAAGGEHAGNAE